MAGKYVAPTYERIEKTDSKGHFFVRLAYGVVGSYKDTSKMTTTEVIEEFLDRNGVKTPREFFEKKFKGKKEPEQEQKAENTISEEEKKKSFEEHKKQMIENQERIVYGKVITKDRVNGALDYGQNGMGETTARLFNEDSFGIGSGRKAQFVPGSNKVELVAADFEDEDSPYSKYGTFYHESWHGIDYNYGDFQDELDYFEESQKMDLKDKIYWNTHHKERQEKYRKKSLSSDYVLSTGQTFHQTLVDEYKEIFDKETMISLAKEIKQEKEEIFKNKYGKTIDEVKAEYNRVTDKASSIYRTQSYEEYKQYINSDEYKEPRKIINKTYDTYHFPQQHVKYGDLSDIVSGATNDMISLTGMGHDSKYWKSSKYARGEEAFAEFASAKATNPESYELMKKYLPKTVAAFEEIFTGLNKGEIKPNAKRQKYQR